MATHPHAHQESSRPAGFSVIVVSDTRSLADDVGGRLLTELAAQAGHDVLSREVVPDDVDRIRAAIDRVSAAGADVILLTGGTGVAPRDRTPEAVEPLYQRRLPGFGEIFRVLSFQEIGAAAMFSRASAGIVGRAAVFALPGSPAGCRLAMERLILPEIGHLLTQIRAEPVPAVRPQAALRPPETPAPTQRMFKPPTSLRQPLDLDLDPGAEPPAADRRSPEPPPDTRPGMRATATEMKAAPPPPGLDPSAAAWHQAITALGGTLDRERREELPEDLERIAPATDVLHRAGQSAAMSTGDGRRYSLWGFPDLHRPGSKVLAIREGSPVPEILVLHRWPFRAGTCVTGSPQVPGHDEDVAGLTERLTGRAPRDPSGSVFAVDRGLVWILREGRVYRWDGRKETDEGMVRSALGRLILQWSER